MKDFFNKDINVGDVCVVMKHLTTSSSFAVAAVERFTPKMVVLKYINAGQYYNGTEIRRYGGDIIVVDGAEVTMWLMTRPVN